MSSRITLRHKNIRYGRATPQTNHVHHVMDDNRLHWYDLLIFLLLTLMERIFLQGLKPLYHHFRKRKVATPGINCPGVHRNYCF